MKKNGYALLFLATCMSAFPEETPRTKWIAKNPFEQKVFIENKGQYDAERLPGILFGARQDGMVYLFGKDGILIKHQAYVKRTHEEIEAEIRRMGIKEENEEDEKEFAYKFEWQHYEMKFLGAGGSTEILAQNEVSATYHFPAPNKGTYIAHAYEKITYKNLYPGIDMEFIFPSDKQGFKYNFIVHPGADPAQIRIAFPDAQQIALSHEGNLEIQSKFGMFVDHAPVANELNTVKPVDCAFRVDNSVIAFDLQQYDPALGVIIDPWTTTPAFSGSSTAYDVDWDNAGNCYVYGGIGSFQVLKYNTGGGLVWSYTSPFSGYYGDFAVDHNSGSVYMIEGFNSFSGANVHKIYNNGTFAASYGGHPWFQEMWRIAFSRCTNQAVIAGGGTTDPSYTGCYLDTNVVGLTPVNVIGAPTGLHDMWGVALDDFGNAYMSTAATQIGSPGYDNILYRMPLPGLTPLAWQVPTGHLFREIASATYAPGPPNGFNGMSVSGTNLYTYDSYMLKKWSTATGANTGNLSINGASQQIVSSGGITSDDCDNLFLGLNSSIIRINGSTMSVVSSFATPGTIYDVALGKNNNLFACGAGWVANYSAGLTFCNSSVLNTSVNTTQATCGNTTGSATVTASGGTGPYTYQWSNGASGSTVSGLPAGTYTVTITDNSCNPQQDQIAVTINTAPSFTLTTSATPVTCGGGTNGTASVSISGGTPSFTVNWSNGQTGTTASNLGAGTYTVTVADGAGCVQSSTTSVTQPTPLSVSGSATAATCSQSNGSASVSASGGTGSLSYTWSPIGGSGTTASGLPAGSYTCLVTDANGCSTNTVLTVSNNAGPSASISGVNNVSCNGGNNGSASVSVTGGTTGYTYTWSPSGGNSSTASGLAAGTYTVNITDGSGCSTSTQVTISQPLVLTGTASSSAALCGAATGSATMSASGGAGGYTYSWSPSGGTSSTAGGLAAGSYTCTVTDANGCVTQAATSISNTGGPSASIASTSSVSCNGGSTGSATASGTGGTGSYTYTWSPAGGNSATASNLSAGTYTCTIADANNCTSTAVVTIQQPAALVPAASTTSVLCNGGTNGSATVSVSGGTAGYTYTWSPAGGNSASAAGLAAGTYTCSITDANGCSTNTAVTIAEPAAVSLVVSASTSITCNAGNNGSASVSASGGVPAYSYTWQPFGGNGATASGLSAGTYTCMMSDANGCAGTATVALAEPNPIAVSLTSSSVTCNGSANGSASAAVSGGTSAYTYTWVPGGGNNANAVGLAGGTYTCNITDANGCTGTSTVSIAEPSAVSVSMSSSDVSCNAGTDGSATAAGSGGTGAFTYTWMPSGGNSGTATGLSAGSYTCFATDANGCMTLSVVTVNEPTAIVSTPTANPVGCSGGTNGSAAVSVAGGTSPYTISWSTSPVQTGTVATNLSAGLYVATITDGNNCVRTENIVVSEPAPVDSLDITGTYCVHDADVLLHAPTGGTAPDTIGGPYQWYQGSTVVTGGNGNTHLGSIVNAGSYSVTWIYNGCRYITTNVLQTIYQDITKLPGVNIFTPNGDAVNDEFIPMSTSNGILTVTYQQIADVVEDYTLYVYDRWGTLVFQTDRVLDTWTGIEINGKEASAGTYFWMAKFKTKCNTDNSEQNLKGYVQLIR